MPRPTKCRKVCHFPQVLEFLPSQAGEQKAPVILTVDEYEAIRLIDKEGLSQEQCCEFMQIARTTVQRIYESARKKLAACLVQGRELSITGGNYLLCKERQSCCKTHCRKVAEHQEREGDWKAMKIGVTYENGQIFQHFGHTEQFKIYEVQDGKVVSAQVVDTNGSGHGALAGFFHSIRWRF